MISPWFIYSQGLDVSYELDLYFYPDSSNSSGKISGVNHVLVINNSHQELRELYFHIAGNNPFLDKPHTTIKQVRTSHGGRVAGSDSLVMRVGLFPPLQKGEKALVDIEFETEFSIIIDAGIATAGSKKDTTVYNGINFYPVLEYFYPDGWRVDEYGKTAKPYSAFASYFVTLTIPKQFQISSSSKVDESKELDTGHVEYVIKDEMTRSVSVAIYDNLKKSTFNINGRKVEIAFPPGKAKQAEEIKDRLYKLIPFYESQFGNALMDKLVIVNGYSIGAQAISNSNYLIIQDGNYVNHLLDHEIAHQWFDYSIFPNEPGISWMNESLAEYASSLFEQTLFKKPDPFTFTQPIPDIGVWEQVKAMDMEDWARTLMEIIGDRSLPPTYDPGKQIGWESVETIYSKYISGRHALQMLQISIGDTIMSQIMKDYYLHFKGKSASPKDFIQTVRKFTNENEAENFRLALTTNLSSDMIIDKVKSVQTQNGHWTHSIFTSVEGQWILPVDVMIVSEMNDTTIKENQNIVNSSVIEIQTKDQMRSTVLDPYKRLFDSNRLNNRWPRQISLRPDYGLPSWEAYKVYYRPRLKRDWRGNWRTGMKLSGGIGINMMPIRPAFYQNQFDLEITFSTGIPQYNWGGKINYRSPLRSTVNTYWEFEYGYEYPKKWSKVSFNNYIGEPKYLAVHGESHYSRITTTFSSNEYVVAEVDGWWSEGLSITLKEKWTIFSYKPSQRYLIETHLICGFQEDDTFYNFGLATDFETHNIANYIVRIHGEAGFAWDEREGNELAFRLLYTPKVWQTIQGRVPLFRGVSEEEKKWHDNIASFGLSVGWETSGPVWPMVYIDAAKAHDFNGTLIERIDSFSKEEKTFISAGIGIESQTLMEIGLYFPLWVSHPVRGESKFALRTLLQWGFYF